MREMFFGRRELLGGGAFCMLAGASRAWAVEPEYCSVEVSQGRLRGLRQDGIDCYLGVPYAGSVTGEHRFLAAPPPTKWIGVRDAIQFGSPAMQPRTASSPGEPPPSEDCLVLNIWTPQGGASAKPVMVYSHGGGFLTGSGGNPVQDGANLAREHDVVVVSTNHRLGAFGFLYLDHLAGPDYAGSGNRGVQDIARSLKWISKNIGAVGGDPHNVMIFGESGGGLKTSCLYAMPEAEPYFHKASIESGPGVRMLDAEIAAQTTRKVLAQLGLHEREWRKLLEIPAIDIINAQTAVGRRTGDGSVVWSGRDGPIENQVGAFAGVRDGVLLPQHPFDPTAPKISRNKPLMVGWNKDEEMFFSISDRDLAAWTLDENGLMDRLSPSFGSKTSSIISVYRENKPDASFSELYFAIQSDLFSGLGSELIAERKTQQGGAPAYHYTLTYEQGAPVQGTSARLGAMHALDIVLKFDNPDSRVPGRPSLGGPRPERRIVAKTMSTMWATFARTGKPAAPGQPAWPAYNLKDRPTMCIDVECHIAHDPHRRERLFWEQK